MVVFNQFLGLKVTSVGSDRVSARIVMRPELVGHYSFNLKTAVTRPPEAREAG